MTTVKKFLIRFRLLRILYIYYYTVKLKTDAEFLDFLRKKFAKKCYKKFMKKVGKNYKIYEKILEIS